MALRVRLGRADEFVEGQLRSIAVAGVTWPVLVTRVDGELVATAGVCPHEDVALADGELDRGAIVCPGHAYRFDLRTGTCTHDPDLRLRRYKLTITDGEVWADLL